MILKRWQQIESIFHEALQISAEKRAVWLSEACGGDPEKVRHGHAGRPSVPKETRELIRTLSRSDSTWGAPRIHSELLKLGIEISEASLIRDGSPPLFRKNFVRLCESHGGDFSDWAIQ